MKTKDILAKGIQVVTFLFAGFGNFLLNIAPPAEVDPNFAVGLSSVLSLFALLFISATTKNFKKKFLKKIWLATSLLFFAIAIVSAITYKDKLNTLTFSYPPENPQAQRVGGAVLTPIAEKYRQENPHKTVAETVAAFGGLASIERVWTRDSIGHAKKVLTIDYIIVVLSVAFMLFSLTEGVLMDQKDKS
jgi:preprotein translocase subunit SecG